MNFSQLQTEVKDFLHRSNLDSKIPTFIKIAIKQIERQNNWKCMEARTSVASSSEFIDLPTRYKETIWLFCKDDTNYYRLQKNSPAEIFSKYQSPNSSKNRPVYFATMRDVSKYILRPIPDKSYTFDIYHYAFSTELSADGDTNWWLTNAWDLVLYKTLIIASRFTKSDEDLKMWQAYYDEQYDMLRQSEIGEDWGGSGHRIGDPTGIAFNFDSC